jgi:hypothetical protein
VTVEAMLANALFAVVLLALVVSAVVMVMGMVAVREC